MFQYKEYGKIRIVAGDKRYPYGTIVRINNSRAGEPIIAIILDRGGSVGIGKATMFDLLFSSSSEASRFGTSNNCTFEIHSGAGGTEAMDWASMLLRMYQMYFDKQGYKYEIVDGKLSLTANDSYSPNYSEMEKK